MSFKSEEEIFQDIILYQLSATQIHEFKNIPADELIRLHHSFGQWIRNHYGLWDKNNPHVIHNDGTHDLFPDQISQRIIERLWSQLTGKEIKERLEVKQTGPNTYQIGRVTIQKFEEDDGTE